MKFSNRRGLAFVLFCLMLAGTRGQAQVSVSGGTKAPSPTDKPLQLSIIEKARLGLAPPSRLYPQIKLDSARKYELPAPTERELRVGDKRGRLRIGALRELPQALDAPVSTTSVQVADGKVYLFVLGSAGAQMLRVHFSHLTLPPGARLFVSSRRNPDEFYGPYENTGPDEPGQFWSPPVSGDALVVECFVPSQAKAESQASLFRVDQVSHIFRDPRNRDELVAQNGAAPCNAPVTPAWSEAAKSVALLQYIESKGEFACTGTLISNTDKDGTPYFLTANHCLNSTEQRYGFVIYWFYDSATLLQNLPKSQGFFFLNTGVAGDFTLLRLQFVPTGVRFSGWTTQTPAPGTESFSIHHPQADFKRFSAGNLINATCPFDFPGGCDNFLKVRWRDGITEPGSSGGPLWVGGADDPQLVGILTGGLSSCSNRSGTDFYGRFDLAFNASEFYLAKRGCAYRLLSNQPVFGSLNEKTEEFFSAAGGDGSVRLKVVEGSNCNWTAGADVPWIAITSATNGAGETVTTYTVAAHSGSQPRQGVITIANQSLLVVQGAAGNCAAAAISLDREISGALTNRDCRSAFDPSAYADRYSFQAQAGQQISINLFSREIDTVVALYGSDGRLLARNDDYSAQDTNSLIPSDRGIFTIPADGMYTIEATSYDSGETGSYTLATRKFCRPLPFEPVSPVFPAEGGEGTVTATFPPDCSWTAGSREPWLTINAGANGTGKGVVRFSVAPNPVVAMDNGTGPRTGSIDFGIGSYAITQRPQCGFRATPTTITPPIYDGLATFPFSETIFLSTGAGCPWNAVSNAPWIEFADKGASFSAEGSRSVAFQFTSLQLGNQPRTGTVTVAGRNITITQSPVGYSCPPTAIILGQTVNDSIRDDCRAIASDTLRGRHYRFSGRAGQRIVMNFSSAEVFPRVQIHPINADQTLSMKWVTGGDSFDMLDGASLRIPAFGYATLPVTGDYLIEIRPGVYTANNLGKFSFTVAEVSATDCQLALSEPYRNFLAGSGSGTVNVTIKEGGSCSWTARATEPWINITQGATGTGNGSVNYTLAANPGAFRTGVIVVGDVQYLISQQPGNSAVLVSAADYTPRIGRNTIVSLFGAGLASQTIAAQSLPLPTMLGDTKIILKDNSGKTVTAPLFFVSSGQINFLVPSDFYPTVLTATVMRGASAVATAEARITQTAPGLFTADAGGRGLPAGYLLRVLPNTTQITEPIYQVDAQGRIVPRPITIPDNESVFLVLFGMGISGGNDFIKVFAQFGGGVTQESFAFASREFVGVDQINIPLPRNLRGRGDLTFRLETANNQATNPVTIRMAN